jgi:acetyltransferase-like isoleucine patch superfamily enzyme
MNQAQSQKRKKMAHETAIIDPTAAIIGEEVEIGEFVIIRPKVIVGYGVVVKARATIGEGTVIGTDTFIGPHTCISVWDVQGNHKSVKIGKRCFIGTGSIILPGVEIGDDVVIGAGSVVSRHCKEPGIYMGSPCKKV